ncbi:MAG: cell division protein FtsQ/DivIB [Betaproteobacteria bacterium]
MSSVAAPADRRFRRAHVKPARRRHAWQRFALPLARWAVAGATVAGVGYYGSTAVIHARVLQIDRIVVRGNDHLSRGEVLAVLGGLRGQNLIWVDLAPWRRRLLASPWVRDAALRRSLPSTVEVTVSERQPIGIGRIGSALYLVDEQGTLIDQYGPEYAGFDLPIIDGLAPGGQAASGTTDSDRAGLAARVVAAVRGQPEISRRLSQVDVRDLHDATVILTGDPAVLHLGEDQFLERLESYLELAPALKERVNAIDYVDLRFGQRVYVRPASAPVGRSRGAAPAHERRRTR